MGHTRRWASALLALILGGVGMSSEDTWDKVSRDAIRKAVAADNGTVDVFPMSYAGAAIVKRYGWTPGAVHYLDAVLTAQHADGGWGNPFGDTALSHTVTTTQHVGPFLLMGYKAGKVPRRTVTRALDYVYRLARNPASNKPGWCLAPDTASPDMCIHNISAGAALFVQQAIDAGITYRPGMARLLISKVTSREQYAYDAHRKAWRYRDDRPEWNDQDHNALCVEAMLRLAPATGRQALTHSLAGAYDKTAPLAHAHLKQFDRKLGAKWVSEARRYINTPFPGGRPGQNIAFWRYAEIAYWASL